jgi:hypothetical protein
MTKRGLPLLAPLLLAAAGLSQPANSEEPASGGPRVVNVSADSEAGWTPSVELERAALADVDAFYAALERGDDAAAYRMVDDLLKSDISADRYKDDSQAFRIAAGATLARQFNQVTWTKDSPAAPEPGIYVAIDIAAKYEKIDRFCGYIVLHQSRPSAPFLVSRIESNYIANGDATGNSADPGLRSAWQQLTANCPNYRPLELEEAEDSTIGYESVAAALAGLHAQPGVTFEEQDGWTVAFDDKTHTVWSFPPPNYPAYPAAVKRAVVSKDGGSYIEMNVHCEASKQACDDLVRTFSEMNAEAVR